jgi:hypothetical protein
MRTTTTIRPRRKRYQRGPRYPRTVIRALPGWRLYRHRRRVGEIRICAQGFVGVDRFGRQIGIYPTTTAAIRAIGRTEGGEP